jgi:hypothetical protein
MTASLFVRSLTSNGLIVVAVYQPDLAKVILMRRAASF